MRGGAEPGRSVAPSCERRLSEARHVEPGGGRDADIESQVTRLCPAGWHLHGNLLTGNHFIALILTDMCFNE